MFISLFKGSLDVKFDRPDLGTYHNIIRYTIYDIQYTIYNKYALIFVVFLINYLFIIFIIKSAPFPKKQVHKYCQNATFSNEFYFKQI